MNFRIKDIAKERGLSLIELADKIGVTYNTLNRNISANPTIDTLQKIADALNVHITELFQKPIGNTPAVSGFIKIENKIYEIKSIDDLKDLYTSL